MLAKVSDHLLELLLELLLAKGLNVDNKVIGVMVSVFGNDTSAGLSTVTLQVVSCKVKRLGDGRHTVRARPRKSSKEFSKLLFPEASHRRQQFL